jgi:hypothetical protein
LTSTPLRRGASRTTGVRREAHAVVESCAPGLCYHGAILALDRLGARFCCMIALLPLAYLSLHVRVSKPVARRETVKMVHLELGSGQAVLLRDLVVLTFLSWSSWKLHAVQQIFDSFTHEPPVLARQDSSHIVDVARIFGRTRLIHVSSRLRCVHSPCAITYMLT